MKLSFTNLTIGASDSLDLEKITVTLLKVQVKLNLEPLLFEFQQAVKTTVASNLFQPKIEDS